MTTWDELHAEWAARDAEKARERAAWMEWVQSGQAAQERIVAQAEKRKALREERQAQADQTKRELAGRPRWAEDPLRSDREPRPEAQGRINARNELVANAEISNNHISEVAHATTTTVQDERLKLEESHDIHVYRHCGATTMHRDCWCQGTR